MEKSTKRQIHKWERIDCVAWQNPLNDTNVFPVKIDRVETKQNEMKVLMSFEKFLFVWSKGIMMNTLLFFFFTTTDIFNTSTTNYEFHKTTHILIKYRTKSENGTWRILLLIQKNKGTRGELN